MIACPVCLHSPDPVDDTWGARAECECGALQFEPDEKVWSFARDRDSQRWLSLMPDGTVWFNDNLEDPVCVRNPDSIRRFIESAVAEAVMES